MPYIFNLFESDLVAIHNMNHQSNQKSAKVGLPICQHLCKKMGGTIKVHAVKEKGSKFWFVLPITPIRNNNEVVNIANDPSQILVENYFKNSKATDGSNQNHEGKDKFFVEES